MKAGSSAEKPCFRVGGVRPTTIAKYEYDGLNRRVKKHIDSQAPDEPDGIDLYRHFFYNAAWQILEARESDTENTQPETLQPEYQHVWSERYIDAPVLRDKNTDDDGLCDDERIYFLTDANFNITCLVDAGGDPLERYIYDAYGSVSVLDADWSLDANNKSDYANAILFGGYHYDAETGLLHVRNRSYDAELGRWMERDPIGYADGMSLYEYAGSAPDSYVDPLGVNGIPLTISKKETTHKPGDKVTWAAFLKGYGYVGEMFGASHWSITVKVKGEYDDSNPCTCKFTIESMHANTDIDVAGVGTRHAAYIVVKAFRRYKKGEWPLKQLKLANILAHERGHRTLTIALAKKYKGILTRSRSCYYTKKSKKGWKGWVQSKKLCATHAGTLKKKIDKRALEYAYFKLHDPYDKALSKPGIPAKVINQSVTHGRGVIKKMKMDDWSCQDTLD